MLFGASPRDVGRPFRDLEISYRPLELRRPIEQAAAERRTVRIEGVGYPRGSDVHHYDVHVSPLLGADNGLFGVSITFLDVTDFHRLRDELEQANRQLETAYEELQSTNEELETTNEELQTTNNELQDRTGDLDRANSFLETILTGLSAGVVVLDPHLHVQVWNRQAQELWGLRREETVGQHFLNLDIGLPTDRLRPLIRGILSGDDPTAEQSLSAVNRRGRRIDVRVLATPMVEGGAVAGVILTMESTGNHDRPAVGGDHGGDHR